MPNPDETRDNSSDETLLDRATFLRSGLRATVAVTVLGGSAVTALWSLNMANSGYQLHRQYGHAIGTSELRDRVHKFLMEVNVPDEEWCSRYSPVFEAHSSGDDSKLPELKTLWEEKKRRFGFEATYERIFGHEPRYERVCDWPLRGQPCDRYAFQILRREGTNGRSVHHEGFAEAVKEMGYVPVEEPQDFDIIMYYRANYFGSTVKPTHWGMMRGGQVISVNLSEEYIMRHNVDAIGKDRGGGGNAPTHVMYFRKADPNLRDPSSLPLTEETSNFVELHGAMVSRDYAKSKGL